MQAADTNVFKFSTDDLPERNRMESLREVYGRVIIKHDIEPAEDRPFRFEGTLYGLSGLGLASYVVSPCRAPRGPQHIDSDDLVLSISFGGHRMIEQRGREAVMGPGEAVMTTSGDPGVVTVGSTCRLVSIRIPSSVLRPMIADFDACLLRTMPRDTEALKFLIGYLDAIRQAEALKAQRLRGAVVKHIHDLVATALGARADVRHLADERGIRAARRAAVLHAIESRSRDPALSAVVVAASLGVTPRYVHLLLDGTGQSFTHHLLAARLEKVAALLRDPLWRDRRVADIANEAGFTDLSHFNRAFRRRFGMTPSDMREAAMREV